MSVEAPDPVAAAVARVFREERPAIIATLVRQAGDIQTAEDALQDAFVAAAGTWPRDGVPGSPGAWITVAARRRAIDRLRRDQAVAARAERLAELMRLDAQVHSAAADDDIGHTGDTGNADFGDTALGDDRLRLIFTCCHPALDWPARVALTLRVVGGLTTAQIARAFLVAEPTMGKRIVRAKRKIADAHIPYRVPAADELPDRLADVLHVLYLIFSEGYAASSGDRLVHTELCAEAVRLAELMSELMPEEPDVWALLALMLLHDARSASRVDPAGRFAALDDQDRTLWDRARISRGLAALRRAARSGRPPGRYLIEAAVTALHIEGADSGATDWAQIAALYGRLAELDPSPVVELNRAAAVGFADGPEAGLALLAPLLDHPALAAYQPLFATHADLLRRAGDPDGAERAYRQAIELSGTAVERAELARRLEALPLSKSPHPPRRPG